MKISVITVVFNAVSTLSRALDSVAAQTHSNVEHIVIDGGSGDGTVEILERYKDRLAYVVSEPDKGIYDGMNKGLKHATGEVVCFLNADDFYPDSHILERVAWEMQDSTLDALFGDVAFFRAGAPEQIIRRYSSRNFSPKRIPYGWMPAHPALFMRRRIYTDQGGFRSDFKIAGDFEFIARVFGRGKAHYKYLPQVMVLMQAGGVSTSGFRSMLLLNREVLIACRDNGLKTNFIKILSKYPLKIIEFVKK